MTKENLEHYRVNLKELKRFAEHYRMFHDFSMALGTFDCSIAKKTTQDINDEMVRLCKKISTLLKEKRAIEKEIDNVNDASESLLLRYRYIDGYGWEEISELMNYSHRNLHYLHKKALSAVAN